MVMPNRYTECENSTKKYKYIVKYSLTSNSHNSVRFVIFYRLKRTENSIRKNDHDRENGFSNPCVFMSNSLVTKSIFQNTEPECWDN